jgi:DNA-binding MarR family transcriptional regulator
MSGLMATGMTGAVLDIDGEWRRHDATFEDFIRRFQIDFDPIKGYMPLDVMISSVEKILSPCHCAVLRKASRHVSQVYDTALAPTGLKTTQFSLLAAIDRGEDALMSMRELADVMVMDRSTLGHNLRPLEKQTFIKFISNKGDARSRHVQLTRKGRSKLEEARVLWRAMQDRFESSFGTSPTTDLRRSLLILATTDFSSPSQN